MKSATDRTGRNALRMKAPIHAEGGGDDPSLPGYDSFIDYPDQVPPPRFKTFGKFRAPRAGYTCREIWPEASQKTVRRHSRGRATATPQQPFFGYAKSAVSISP